MPTFTDGLSTYWVSELSRARCGYWHIICGLNFVLFDGVEISRCQLITSQTINIHQYCPLRKDRRAGLLYSLLSSSHWLVFMSGTILLINQPAGIWDIYVPFWSFPNSQKMGSPAVPFWSFPNSQKMGSPAISWFINPMNHRYIYINHGFWSHRPT